MPTRLALPPLRVSWDETGRPGMPPILVPPKEKPPKGKPPKKASAHPLTRAMIRAGAL